MDELFAQGKNMVEKEVVDRQLSEMNHKVLDEGTSSMKTPNADNSKNGKDDIQISTIDGKRKHYDLLETPSFTTEAPPPPKRRKAKGTKIRYSPCGISLNWQQQSFQPSILQKPY